MRVHIYQPEIGGIVGRWVEVGARKCGSEKSEGLKIEVSREMDMLIDYLSNG
jgi:hypothetical protein